MNWIVRHPALTVFLVVFGGFLLWAHHSFTSYKSCLDSGKAGSVCEMQMSDQNGPARNSAYQRVTPN